MKSNVLVPVSGHPHGLHDGHKAVISFAKEISNEVDVSILSPDRHKWYQYLKTGEPMEIDQDVSASVEAADKLGVKIKIRNRRTFPEEYRIEKYKQAAGLASHFDLILDAYTKMAPMVLMGSLLIPSGMTTERTEAIVRGPELMNFMLEAARKLIGFHIPTTFYQKIIKDPDLGIKKSTLTETVHPAYRQEVKNLNQVILGAKGFYKVGGNEKLVKELNHSYRSKIWEIRGIAVFEGGFVPGRLEITQFVFPTAAGWVEPVTLEEVDYQC